MNGHVRDTLLRQEIMFRLPFSRTYLVHQYEYTWYILTGTWSSFEIQKPGTLYLVYIPARNY